MNTSLEFHIEHFEGPMDLLMHLLEKNKIDISNIPIAELTDQYLAYLREREAMNLDIASSFLLMAAQLIRIKVRMLLPRRPKDEDDPRQPLVEQILEYRFVKSVAEELDYRAEAESRFVSRTPNRDEWLDDVQPVLQPITLSAEGLRDLFLSLLVEKPEEPVVHLVQRDVSINEWVDRILMALSESEGLSFGRLVASYDNRQALLGCFLAMLECLHQNDVIIRQDVRFGPIWILPNGEDLL